MRRKHRLRRFIIFVVVILVLTGLFFVGKNYLLTKYHIDNVYVDGNVHYSDEEIISMIMNDKFSDNSLYLKHKYKNKEITDIPFVETIDVETSEDNTVKIHVYEKALAGYIEYLGKYVYFDKDGVVVEVSEMKTKGIPEVLGVDFDYVVLHEQLPAKNTDLFKDVLDITQLLTKYNVPAGRMFFTSMGDIVIVKDEIIIYLGTDANLDLKIMNLPSILVNLEGKKGVLHMENYDEGTKRITFEVDDKGEENE